LRRGLEVVVPRAKVKADQLYPLYTILKKELEFVRNKIKQYYNKYRLEGPCLEKGDKVYLIVQNL
jgi:DNA polymerase II large subunit